MTVSTSSQALKTKKTSFKNLSPEEKKAAFEAKKEKYLQLSELSKIAAELREHNEEFQDCETLNEIIIDVFYKKGENKEFHSFVGWKEKGYRVKKGETAFLIWGKPRKKQGKEDEKKDDEEEKPGAEFFPLAYIFSNNQVEKIEK